MLQQPLGMREELPDRPRYEGEIPIKWQTSCFVSSQLVVGPDLGQQCLGLIFTNNYFRHIVKLIQTRKKNLAKKELNKECESIKSSSENKPLLIKPKAEEQLKKLTAIAAKKSWINAIFRQLFDILIKNQNLKQLLKQFFNFLQPTFQVNGFRGVFAFTT